MVLMQNYAYEVTAMERKKENLTDKLFPMFTEDSIFPQVFCLANQSFNSERMVNAIFNLIQL